MGCETCLWAKEDFDGWTTCLRLDRGDADEGDLHKALTKFNSDKGDCPLYEMGG